MFKTVCKFVREIFRRKQWVIYGSVVGPFTGPEETKRGRVVIFQELIPELEESIRPEDIDCKIFCPSEIMQEWQQILNLDYDPDSIEPCLFFKGDTAALVKLLKEKIPGLKFMNSDNDRIFAKLAK